MTPPTPTLECWFLTGSQGLYGEDTLGQVAQQAQAIADTLDKTNDAAVSVVFKPVLTDAASIRRVMLDANSTDRCIGVIAWMHTFSPAKMWIAGLDALAKPLLHLHTQANVDLPWASIDMDFMNLHQAAHGDREFGYIQTRQRKSSQAQLTGHPYSEEQQIALAPQSAHFRAKHERIPTTTLCCDPDDDSVLRH